MRLFEFSWLWKNIMSVYFPMPFVCLEIVGFCFLLLHSINYSAAGGPCKKKYYLFGRITYSFGQIRNSFGRISNLLEQIEYSFGRISYLFRRIRCSFGQIRNSFGGIRNLFGRISYLFGRIRNRLLTAWKSSMFTSLGEIIQSYTESSGCVNIEDFQAVGGRLGPFTGK